MSFPPYLKAFFAIAIAAFAYVTCSATELHLTNGDVITGDFDRREGGKIYFHSAILGELIVDESQAVVVQTLATPVESLAGLPPPQAKGGAAPSTVVKSTTPHWQGKVEFGFQQQTGRQDSVAFSLRGDAERKVGVNDYKAEARMLYGKQGPAVNTDRYDASFQWRHELSERVFGQALSSYTRDRVQQIDANIEQNFGAGYRLIQRTRNAVNVGGGLTLQYRQAQGVDSGVIPLGELFEDYSYKLTGRLTFTQEAHFLYSPSKHGQHAQLSDGTLLPIDENAENYRVRFNSALQGRVSDHVSLNLRYEYEFDNSILAREAKTEQRLTSSIGYGF